MLNRAGAQTQWQNYSHEAISPKRRGFFEKVLSTEQLLNQLAAFAELETFSSYPLFCSSSTH
jgi:hypothetical protein